MNKNDVRCFALGLGLCITAGLLSHPAIAQSTGRNGSSLSPAEIERKLELDARSGRHAAQPFAPPSIEEKLRLAGRLPVDRAEKLRLDGQAPVDMHAKLVLDGQIPPDKGAQPGDWEGSGPVGLVAPPNDSCATPTIATIGLTPFTNVDATSEASDPVNFPCTSGALNTVWFQFTAAASGTAIIDTCTGTTFDTTIGVFTGPACGPYVQVACNDDSCGAASLVSFAAVSGTVYRIEVDGFGGATGSGNLSISAATPPANDECGTATILPAAGPFPIVGTQSTTLATSNASDPVQSCSGGTNSNSVWFQWTPSSHCNATFATCTSSYDTVVTVYSGACGALGTELACSDDFCGLQSQVTWAARAGTTYRIEACDFGSPGGGTLNYSLDCSVAAPSNDACATPIVLPASGPFPVTGSQVTTGATTAGTDPSHSCSGGIDSNSVWFQWTPSATCSATFATCTSSYDTVVAVYSGTCAAPGAEVACSDDFCGLQSTAAWTATGGTTYLIEACDFGSPGGGFLAFALDCFSAVPANDGCGTPTIIPGSGPFPFTTSQNTTGATTAPTDPMQSCTFGAPSQNSHSVWYSFTPTSTCDVTFDTCTSAYDTVVSVHTGTCSSPAPEVACNDDFCGLQSQVTFTAVAGTTYLIDVTSFDGGAGGALTVTLNCVVPPPANDSCSSATVINCTSTTSTVSENTSAATTAVDDPLQSCTFGGPAQNSNSVWFRFTATCRVTATFDACTSAYDTVMTAYTGQCGALTEIACNDDGGSPNCPGSLQSGISFTTTAGTTYFIEVTDFATPGGGVLNLNFRCVDTTAPTINCPANVSAECTSPSGAVVSYMTSAQDECGGPVNIVCNPAAGSTFPFGSTTVTCTATDSSMNSSSCSFSVTVRDTTPPRITCPSDVTAECAGTNGTSVTYTATATDLCDTTVDVSCTPASGSSFPLGTTQVCCTASDSSENSSQCCFNVSVSDTTAPTIQCSGDITIDISDVNQPVDYLAAASDACDPNPTLECDPPSGSVFSPGHNTVVCMATDRAGNMSSCRFDVTVIPCINFDHNPSNGSVIGDMTPVDSLYLTLGVAISATSNETGPGSAIARPQGSPGSATDDLVPVTAPNYCQTNPLDGTSDSGVIEFRFVDPQNPNQPRTSSLAKLTFLDVEASGGGQTRLDAYDVNDILIGSVIVPVGPNGGQFTAQIGEVDGPLEIAKVVASVGSPGDSAGVDEFCYFLNSRAIDLTLMGPGRDVTVGTSFPLYYFTRNGNGRRVPTDFRLYAQIRQSAPEHTLMGPRHAVIGPHFNKMDQPLVRRILLPNNPRIIGHRLIFTAGFFDPGTSNAIVTDSALVRFVQGP
ncbi:MAG: HYR domain-containing protein [Planctomycetes bacterium]|nr:HYR domain-containing protein [Planctomycetota bacterium]MBI3844858.1 HYR domain-containing protein [Planctomycetota bacterium]